MSPMPGDDELRALRDLLLLMVGADEDAAVLPLMEARARMAALGVADTRAVNALIPRALGGADDH